MRTVDFISPVMLSGPYINAADLYVSPSGPDPSVDVQCEVSIDIPDNREVVHEDGVYRLAHEMTVGIALYQMPEAGRVDYLRVNLSMGGVVSVSDQVSVQDGSIEHGLLLNGVSLFYSSARSYIEMITSMSSMGRFTIPAIDPEAYVGERGGEGGFDERGDPSGFVI